jgi:signal transduction histidine kinase
MADLVTFVRSRPLLALILLLPPGLFLLFWLFPGADISVWETAVWFRAVHAYLMTFAGFVALVTALYANLVLGGRPQARLQFITLAFAAMAAMMLLSGLATPQVFFTEQNNRTFVWSANLSLPVGALFFALAATRWPKVAEGWLQRWRKGIGAVVLLVLVLYMVLVTAVTQPFLPIPVSLVRPLLVFTGTAAVVLLLWSSRRIWSDLTIEGTLFGQRLALAVLLLAEAQLFFTWGRQGALSWLLFYPLILLGLMMAVWAILSTLRANRELQVSRYFAVTGSILIVGVSLLLGELAILFFDLQDYRRLILALMLTQGILSFLSLLAIVIYLDRLVRRRTQELAHEQRRRLDLTQMIVHDLKSPLTVVRSGISLLVRGHLGGVSPRQHQVLYRIEEANQRLLQLIDNMLDVERLEAGVLPLRRQTFQVAPWLGEGVAAWESVAEVQGKRLDLIVAPDLPLLCGDKDLLLRVLNNLLANAFNYASNGSQITISARLEAPHVAICVADDGPGVPDGDKERIFEKFAQVEGALRRGAGLGLTFCKMVVEAHDGQLVVCDNPTGGAIFRFTLPLSERRLEIRD